ncbi:MAG: aminopeptidase [Puniceicoccales bacterium]|jgi:aminopeptidase|nr:aminopeptidase [Puniceicoccales bacterium]
MDLRHEKLAEVLVGFSMAVQRDDRVLVDVAAVPEEMVVALLRSIRAHGGRPFVQFSRSRTQRELLSNGSEEDFALLCSWELEKIRSMQCYVAIRGSDNVFELGDVAASQQNLYREKMKPAHDHRIGKTRWTVLRWPNPSMAQAAKMSTEAFEDFFFRVCTMDYGRMEPGMAALKSRMDRADRVHILGPGTDLRFSVRGIGAIPCGGRRNIPDGEVFTAPVRDSVEGVIAYNTPSVYSGQCFENVRLSFKGGRIVEATAAHKTDALNAILDSDDGARHVGEFALGFHPHILTPLCDILFDEKIAGSLHFTPGQAYENEADNGNRSQIHWDLVLIQRPEFGGGEIYFDDELIRRDGLFVPDDLLPLNPDSLLRSL